MIRGKRRAATARFAAGRRALAAHDPARALPEFRAAVDAVSADSGRTLARYLYWLAVALFKLGKLDLAIKALASAQKLEPRGRARAFYCRASNEYGMARASCSEHDDYKAFFSIQVRRYLATVPGGRFADEVEMETVLAVIADAWIRLAKTTNLDAEDCSGKLSLFRAVRIQFPGFGGEPRAGRILAGDFGLSAAAGPVGRCPCGSGLPYQRCCGRIPIPGEHVRG